LVIAEFAGLGPAPFAGMLLSDMGADIVCIDPLETASNPADVIDVRLPIEKEG
jgi:alpha-methylacyl-CoA racemase